jgi:hypothetical protein
MTSSSATGCRWPTMSKTVRAGTKSSRWQPKSKQPVRRSSTPASAGMRRGCRPSSPQCQTARSSTSTTRGCSTSTASTCGFGRARRRTNSPASTRSCWRRAFSPRMPDMPGIDHPMVLSYAEAITGKQVGKTVAVVGAGGIGIGGQAVARIPGAALSVLALRAGQTHNGVVYGAGNVALDSYCRLRALRILRALRNGM